MEGRALGGISVLELARGLCARASGAILADWGADVVLVRCAAEDNDHCALPHRDSSDVVLPALDRGKRELVLPLDSTLLGALAAGVDVFLTDLTVDAAERAGLGVADLAAVTDNVVYARASGVGSRGSDQAEATDDTTAYWARGGLATTFQLIDHSLTEPTAQPAIGFGALPAGALLAGGIAAAIYRRAATGTAGVVDVSLLGFAAYNLSMDVVSVASGTGPSTGTRLLPPSRYEVLNPLTNCYRTSDGRFITLCVLQERFFTDVCERLGCPELVSDPRFSMAAARVEHAGAMVRILDEVFATRTQAEWAHHLASADWVWEPVQTAEELVRDLQVEANGYVDVASGTVAAVAGPVQFDERSPMAPSRFGGDDETEAVLRDLGIDAATIKQLRDARVVR